jgi:hypothetical protein
VLFASHLVRIAHGATEVRHLLKEFSGGCQRWGRKVTSLQGIFCANFWAKRGHWGNVRGPGVDLVLREEECKFPIRIPINDGGLAVLDDVKDEGRFLMARNGDYLITRFQCGKCHFQIFKDETRWLVIVGESSYSKQHAYVNQPWCLLVARNRDRE